MRISIGLIVLALAMPASAGLINGGFEAGLAGWTVSNVMNDPSSYVPNPAFLDGEHRAGDSNCQNRNSSGVQGPVSCDPVLPDPSECHLTGGLAGGHVGGAYSYWVTLIGANDTDTVSATGVNNWILFDLVVHDSCDAVTVEFGATAGDATWGPAGYHVDALVLECVPEPASLMFLGLAGLPLLRRRR